MSSGTFGVSNNSSGLNTWVVWWTSDDPGNNRSGVHAELWARRNSATTFGTGTWSIGIDGWVQSASGSRSIGTSDTLIAAFDFYWIGHNEDGSRQITISVSGGMPGTSWTSTSGSSTPWLTDYDRRPGAPHTLSVAGGSVTTSNFAVFYLRDAAGTTILQDHAEWSKTDGTVVWNDYGPSGYTSPGPGTLTPSTVYRVRVRSRNSDGWGPFSGYLIQATLGGVYVGKDGAYVPAEVYVGKGGVYVLAEIQVGDDGVFVAPA